MVPDELKQTLISLRIKLMQLEAHLPAEINLYADLLTEIDRLCFHHQLSSAELELMWHEYELGQMIESAITSGASPSQDLPTHLLDQWLNETAPSKGQVPVSSNSSQSVDSFSKPLNNEEDVNALDQYLFPNQKGVSGASTRVRNNSAIDENLNKLFD